MSLDSLVDFLNALSLVLVLLVAGIPLILARYIKFKRFLLFLLSTLILSFLGSTFFLFFKEEVIPNFLFHVYGFNPYGMGGEEQWTKAISATDRAEIQEIYEGTMGIGWPLKLLLSFVILGIPYNIVACGLVDFYQRKYKK